MHSHMVPHEKIYYDIMQSESGGLPFYVVGIGLFLLCFIFIVASVWIARRQRLSFPLMIRSKPVMLPFAGMLFSLVWLFISYTQIEVPYKKLRECFVNGECSVVSGTVERFHTGSGMRGDTLESFSINGVTFNYYAGTIGPGFHQTRSEGGPIQENLKLKIYYYDNIILKLIIY